VEETFTKIEMLHKETHRHFNIYKKGFTKFLQWQGECQDAFNKAVLKIMALEEKEGEDRAN